MADQDWKVITVGGTKKSGGGSKPKTNEQALNSAKTSGASVETRQKQNAAKNNHASGSTPSWKVEENDEREDVSYKRDTVDVDISIRIQQARLDKKMTQKELATAINEKATVITDYENGNAVPNPQVISKLERALGVKLRPGKGKGKGK
eukprot:TRINITY_DN2616_c1_g1_i1.p1 TRINITY_DN2616_c1_g1~~TRINITY_DN2616_c1_g1_i1.p1  ORF type:complete len:160 (-),score=28.60 TRINITY_DN2616_c1_g1_i1:99-545(-)